MDLEEIKRRIEELSGYEIETIEQEKFEYGFDEKTRIKFELKKDYRNHEKVCCSLIWESDEDWEYLNVVAKRIKEHVNQNNKKRLGQT